MKEIKDKIEAVTAELDELYDEGMDGAEALHEDVEARIAELKAELVRLQTEAEGLLDDAKEYAADLVGDAQGFFAKYKIPVLVVAGLLVLGGIVLLVL